MCKVTATLQGLFNKFLMGEGLFFYPLGPPSGRKSDGEGTWKKNSAEALNTNPPPSEI